MSNALQLISLSDFLKAPLLAVQSWLDVQWVMVKDEKPISKERSHELRSVLFQHILPPHLSSASLVKNENGKPFFVEGGFSFSTSHSDDYWSLAWRLSGEVGVDLEKWRNLERLEKVARRHFKEEENESWMTLSKEEEKAEQLLRLWTRKEAMIKAKGSNLFREISGFSALHLKEDEGTTMVIPSQLVFSLIRI